MSEAMESVQLTLVMCPLLGLKHSPLADFAHCPLKTLAKARHRTQAALAGTSLPLDTAATLRP